MTNIVKSLFIPAYNLAKGRNAYGRLYYEEARKEATPLLKGIFKISLAAGALFAASACMNRLSASYSLLGTSVLVVGGIVVGRQIASPFIIHISSIAGSLLLIREGCGTFLIKPLIQSVKEALHGIAGIESLADIGIDLASCASRIALGYFRGIIGIASLGLGLKYIGNAVRTEVKPSHFIDQNVHSLAKKCASFLLPLWGYKKYIPDLPKADLRPLK
ncbi:MAG: hypothetical protein JSS10_08880 [Verrucomicrobia bacterium]|nr:hypothetical protein [Verrucomicrobiota bacterium]